MRERLALVFLVLLRMAIGWHFTFEALEKRHTVSVGPSETNRPWTSEPFFRQGQGPLGKFVRSRIGDTDDSALARMTPLEVPKGQDPAKFPFAKRIPEGLDREWDNYLTKFTDHYRLSPPQQESAKAALQHEKELTGLWFIVRPGTVEWALSGLWNDLDRPPFKRSYPGGTYEVNIAVAERVEEYRDKLGEYRGMLGAKPYSLGKDVDRTRRPALQNEVNALRSELQGLVDNRAEKMKSAVTEAAALTDQQKALGAAPEPAKHWIIRWIDRVTPWLLLAVGLGLLFGCFTRLSALTGALFLVMTILTAPSLPWLPAPPNAEGYYMVVSKNVIEMIALFMLACIPSGRWFGLDALISAVNPWRKRNEEEQYQYQ
jgi:uncharacterized membrane protein YphA (DoxX/SURF4 family)